MAGTGSRPGQATDTERAPSTTCRAVRRTPSGRTKKAVPWLTRGGADGWGGAAARWTWGGGGAGGGGGGRRGGGRRRGGRRQGGYLRRSRRSWRRRSGRSDRRDLRRGRWRSRGGGRPCLGDGRWRWGSRGGRGGDLCGDPRGRGAELLLEAVRVLAESLAPQDGDGAQHRLADLVEPAWLVALLAHAERLPVVEVPGEVEGEALAAHHGLVEAAASVEFQRERLHVAYRENIVEGGGLTAGPVTLGGRLLGPACGDPHLGPRDADESEGDLAAGARDAHAEGRARRHSRGGARLIVELGSGDAIDARDAIATTQPRPLDPLRGGEHGQLSSREIADFAGRRGRFLTREVPESLLRLGLELVGLASHRRRAARGLPAVARGTPHPDRGDDRECKPPAQPPMAHQWPSRVSPTRRNVRVLPSAGQPY